MEEIVHMRFLVLTLLLFFHDGCSHSPALSPSLTWPPPLFIPSVPLQSIFPSPLSYSSLLTTPSLEKMRTYLPSVSINLSVLSFIVMNFPCYWLLPNLRTTHH